MVGMDSKKTCMCEDFFHDNPSLPYNRLPPRSLEQSPCYHIIRLKHKLRTYYCKPHPK